MWAQDRLTNPQRTMVAPRWALTAGINGVAFNRFAWADPITGQVSNAFIAGGRLGIVLPQPWRYARNGWNLAAWSNFVPFGPCPPPSAVAPTLNLRAGMICTLLVEGMYPLFFPGGTAYGQQVFASQIDGSAWTGVAGGGYSATAWTTLASAGANGIALASTYVPPF